MSGTFLRVFGRPLLVALVTALGLLSALLGDGPWDLVSWLALGVPLGVIVWWVGRPARGPVRPVRARGKNLA